MTYFILGNNPELAHEEVLAWLEREQAGFHHGARSGNFLFVEHKNTFSADHAMRELGGTVKIGTVLGAGPMPPSVSEITQALIRHVPEGKIWLGLSLYEAPELKKQGQTMIMEVKGKLQEAGRPARVVTSRDPQLSSVVIKTNRLLTRGAEIVIAGAQGGYTWGLTTHVQYFDDLGHRDFGRPGRDLLSGSLPPKVALCMINLARIAKSATLLDPFCGSGTILTEAMAMGYTALWGSDISPRAVQDTQDNCAWLHKQFPETHTPTIAPVDARTMAIHYPHHFFDALVFEPFLGPPLNGNETPEKRKAIVTELTSLYETSLRQCATILKPTGRIVMIIPEFTAPGAPHIDAVGIIQRAGLAIVPPQSGAPRLIYQREGQKLRRTIWVLRRP